MRFLFLYIITASRWEKTRNLSPLGFCFACWMEQSIIAMTECS
ncbi:MAG: hypothetical protein ACP5I1_01285 [Candidatus Hinthialibacter sp.]